MVLGKPEGEVHGLEDGHFTEVGLCGQSRLWERPQLLVCSMRLWSQRKATVQTPRSGPVTGEATIPGSETLRHPASPRLARSPWSTLKKAHFPTSTGEHCLNFHLQWNFEDSTKVLGFLLLVRLLLQILARDPTTNSGFWELDNTRQNITLHGSGAQKQ